jgi:hypothetical protein
MGPRRTELQTQEIGEQHARLGFRLDGLAVKREADGVARIGA